jgi:hypothetical protein
MRLPGQILLPSSLAVLAGCTSSVVPTSGDTVDAEATQATAVVSVEGFSTGAPESLRTEVVARFVRTRAGAVDDDTLHMVGAALDFPAMGSCDAVTSSYAPSSAPSSGSGSGGRVISLLDVGGVTLFAGEAATALQRRQLPDVADLVSGVVYSARAQALPSRSAYLLRIDGAPESDVAPVVVSAASPGEPTDVTLASDDGKSGPVALTPASSVELTWTPGSSDDVVYVDVGATSVAPAMRCLFEDGGHATIPSTAFGSLEEGTIAVHRLHREPFRTHGVDPGEVRFDFARTLAFVRR